MPDIVIGFSPNWNSASKHNAGLSIYISPGSINGKVYQNGVYLIPASVNPQGLLYDPGEIVYFWMTSDGNIQQSSALPASGVFPICSVTIDNVITGSGSGDLQIPQTGLSNFQAAPPGLVPTFQFFAQTVQAPGVVEISDLRPLGDFSYA